MDELQLIVLQSQNFMSCSAVTYQVGVTLMRLCIMAIGSVAVVVVVDVRVKIRVPLRAVNSNKSSK